MRSIFFLLIFINLIVFAAQWFMPSPAVDEPTQISARRGGEGESLLLLEELDKGRSRQANNTLSEKAVSASAGSDAEKKCTMVGPYAQLLHAEYLVERLRAMEVDAKIQSIEVPEGENFWVYLPPEMSDKEALRRLYEIQAKNIDSYIIPSGELANGISFGMYGDRNLAEKRLEEVLMKGYQAKLRELPRTHSQTWVSLPPGEAEKIDMSVWVELLNQQSGLEKRQNFCLGVAP